MAIDLNALRKKHEQLESKGQGGEDFLEKFMQLKDGKNLLRILPGKEEDDLFYAETKIHRVPTADGKVKNFHCRKVHGEDCPLCDAYFGLWKIYNEGGKVDEEFADAARQIKPRERYYLNVVDRESGSVKILSVGQIIFSKIISTILDEDYGDITDLKEGNDFTVEKHMEGKWPKYDKSAARPKKTAAGKKMEVDAWMDSLHDIQGLVKKEEYEDVRNAAEILLPSLKERPVVSNSAATEDAGEEKEVSDEDFVNKLKS